jgi:nucleoside-diphosphate-sugar epimerase
VAVFHLAAQVAVTTSLTDPVADFQVNVGGAINLLEAVRRQGRRTPLIFASTNKVYGDLADVPLEIVDDCHLPRDPSIRMNGVDERRPLDFHTPYGCSKGAADQYVLDYARSFDLPTCVLRMSCIYGPRQMGTEDQGWVAHFLIRALAGQPITIYGDGRQVRDILYVADAVEAYVSAWRRIEQRQRPGVQPRRRPRQRRQPAASARTHRDAARPRGSPEIRRLAARRPALLRLRRQRRSARPAAGRADGVARRRRQAAVVAARGDAAPSAAQSLAEAVS